jgi:hypothetical protein
MALPRMSKRWKFTTKPKRVSRFIYDWTNRIFPWMNTSVIPFTKNQEKLDRALAQKMLASTASEKQLLNEIINNFNALRVGIQPVERDIVDLYAKLKAHMLYEHAAGDLGDSIAALTGVITRDVQNMEDFGRVNNDLMAISNELAKLNKKFTNIERYQTVEEQQMKKILGAIKTQAATARQIAKLYDDLHRAAKDEFGVEEQLKKGIKAQKEKIAAADTMIKDAFARFKQAV